MVSYPGEATPTPPTPTTRSVDVLGDFSLDAQARLEFGRRAIGDYDGVIRMAFTVDGDHEPTAGVAVRQDGTTLRLQIATDGDPDAVARQTARVLSADIDGRGFDELARRDPVVGRLHHAAAGLRPAQFYSPYEAAAWSIISARRARGQALTVRERLAEAHGKPFRVAGRTVHAFPTPSVLRQITEVPGLPALAIPRLHAVAEAASEGMLDVGRLTALDPQTAMTQLQDLPGIGPFYSALVVARACGLSDVLPLNEPRSRAAIAELYGREPLSDAEFEQLAETWRPYRMWMLFLARAVPMG